MLLFKTEIIDDVDFYSDGFKALFDKEKDFKDAQGRTTLMYVCKYASKLLS